MSKLHRPAASARAPINWVRRRARRLESFFRCTRREAVASAWQDWAALRAPASWWTH
ncbi:hypothetical protein [Variovorax sp.]|uniref:hypothetical protein n=1 Tax=Variovorax sp. TaxID=1871043 RepID=UPI003BAD7EE1